MYQNKVENAMKGGRESEAYAQAKKAAGTLKDVRTGYKEGMNLDIKDLPRDLDKAMEVIDKANIDVNATETHIRRLNNELNSLGYSDVTDVTKDISNLRKNIQHLAEKGIEAVSETTPVSETKTISEPPPIPKSTSSPRSRTVSESKTFPESPPVGRKSRSVSETTPAGVNIWTWLFLIVSVIIAVRGYLYYEVIGILFCSFIVLLSVFIRRKKEKPYNWFSKLIIVVQLLLLS